MNNQRRGQLREITEIEGRDPQRTAVRHSTPFFVSIFRKSVAPGVAIIMVLAMLVVPVPAIQAAPDVPHQVTTSQPSTPGWLCSGLSWQTTHLYVGTGGCQAVFGIEEAANFSSWNSSTQFNYSFAILWIAEVNASGGLVRIASPLEPVSWSGSVYQGSKEVDLQLNQTLNVSTASGRWDPNDTWYGTGAQWVVSNTTIANTNISVTFHLLNVTAGNSYNASRNVSIGAKFDAGVDGWPWASSSDHLGVAFSSLGAGGAHFAFNSSSQVLTELWNSDNQSIVNLVFGGQAEVSYSPAHNASANPSAFCGLFTAGTPLREAVVLLAFGGVAGNFSSLAYDPYVEFGVLPGTSPPPPGIHRPAVTEAVVAELALIAAAAVVSVLVVLVVRSRRLRREGEELVAGMEREISGGDRLP